MASKSEPKRVDVGDKVIELRSAGNSYAAIAREVGVERQVDALKLFLDAIDTRPTDEQVSLRAAENARLDALERRAAANDDPAARERGLASVVKIRRRVSGV